MDTSPFRHGRFRRIALVGERKAGERPALLAHGNSPPAADKSWCGRYSSRHATAPHRLMRFCLFCGIARERDRHPDGFAPISNHAPPSCGSRTRGATAYLLILSAAPAAARRRKMLVIRCLCACRLLNDHRRSSSEVPNEPSIDIAGEFAPSLATQQTRSLA